MYTMMWWHPVILVIVADVRDGASKVMKAGITLDDMR
jgi:hypothetical protein